MNQTIESDTNRDETEFLQLRDNQENSVDEINDMRQQISTLEKRLRHEEEKNENKMTDLRTERDHADNLLKDSNEKRLEEQLRSNMIQTELMKAQQKIKSLEDANHLLEAQISKQLIAELNDTQLEQAERKVQEEKRRWWKRREEDERGDIYIYIWRERE